jgi:lipopolysaccharide transport system permease protein
VVRHVLPELVKRDFRSKFSGTFLGVVWAMVQPLAFVFILSIVFRYGLRQGTTPDGFAFVPWFFCGSMAWNFMAEATQSAAMGVRDYAFLVRKVNFHCWLLPVTKVLSALCLHFIFLLILAGVLLWFGYTPNLAWLEIPVLLFFAVLLVTGLGWVTSAVAVFAKDVGPAVAIVMQFGFWLTPVLWSAKALPAEAQKWLFLNPAFLIVDGYRAILLEGRHLTDLPWQGWAWFLLVTGAFLSFGFAFFTRMRPQFGDVL